MKNLKWLVGIVGIGLVLSVWADVPVVDIVRKAETMPDAARSVNVQSAAMSSIDKQVGAKYGQGVDFVNRGIESDNQASREAYARYEQERPARELKEQILNSCLASCSALSNEAEIWSSTPRSRCESKCRYGN